MTTPMIPTSHTGRTMSAPLPPSSVVCVELPTLEVGVKGADASANNWDRLGELNFEELRSLGQLEPGVLLLKTSPVVAAAVE